MELNDSQRKWLQRAFDVAFDLTDNQEFGAAFASKLYVQSKLNPNFNTPNSKGIASLEEGVEVDPFNAEEALTYAANRDANAFLETGDPLGAVVTSFIDETTDDAAVEAAANSVIKALPFVVEQLEERNTSFTDIESQENRFRQAVSSGDNLGRDAVLSEMVNERVTDRAGQQ